MPFPRRSLLAAALAAAVASPALAQRHEAGPSGPPSATITLSARGVAAGAGAGYVWGDGALRYGGRHYPFSVHGITIADAGISRVSGQGRVYNLHRLQDFSGTYVAATGEATLGNGIAGQVLRNAKGVVIRLDEVTNGARLQASADGIRLALK